MRLDRYLVLRDLVESRSRAKRAIQKGWVEVNGETVESPSREVRQGDEVELVENHSDRPGGYHKLREIEASSDLQIGEDDKVLDLGSSAGGFAEYVIESGAEVVCVEVSEEFVDVLQELEDKYDEVEFFNRDAFELDTREVGGLDVILNDTTVEPDDSLYLTSRYMKLLRENGRVLQVLKAENSELSSELREIIEDYGLEIVDVIDESDKSEVYVVAEPS